MISSTKIKISPNKINKNTLKNLNYETQSESDNLYYDNVYSNTILKYNMTYIMTNRQKKTFTKYFTLSSIIDKETNTYEVLDSVDARFVLQKIGFIKYIVFKKGDLNTIFNANATDDEKESVVTSLNRISPNQFVKIDRLARNYFFKSLSKTNNSSLPFKRNSSVLSSPILKNITLDKKNIFEKIFNVVGKNLKKKKINEYNNITENSSIEPKITSNLQNENYVSNNFLFKDNNVKINEAKQISNEISQTILNAAISYNYVNCKNYTCNSILDFNFQKNNNILKISQYNKSTNVDAEVDITGFVSNINNVSLVKAYKNINIEFYDAYYKETIYKDFQNKILIDPEFLYIEKLKKLELKENKIIILKNLDRKLCNFNKEFYNRAFRIWSVKDTDNDKIISNTNKNSLFIKNIIERYVIVIEENNKETFICFNNIVKSKREIFSRNSELFLNVNESSNLKPNILIEK